MTSLIEEVRKQRSNVLSLNISERSPLARGPGIMATPTVPIIEDNRLRVMRASTLNPKRPDRQLALQDPNG
ncbi:MAG: hypothetical protein V3R65_04110 [Acidiferrobacterales bacterium]